MSTQPFQKLRQNSPLYSGNAAFIEAYYEQYLENPDAVEPQWREYFRSLNGGRQDVAHSGIIARFEQLARQPRLLAPATAGLSPEAAEKQAGVLRLINYYRVRGHQAANLDPLGLQKKPAIPDLDPAFHGLGPEDMQTVFNTGSLQAGPDRLSLAGIIEIMRKVYTGSIGAEYMYITDTQQKRWIQKRLEGSWDQPMLSADDKRSVLQQLTAAEGIERYLHTRYVGQKRFSLEGADSLIPAVDEVVRRAKHHAVDEVVIGMAHRGRLNVLVNILGKSPKELFDEFEGNYDSKKLESSGDVKYHMGFSTDVEVNGRRTHLVLAFNPSHLEIVNPVVEGSVRARQERRNDASGELILPVLIHGDAAFAGQGVVMETLQLSQSKGYSTGGTIHVIVNNQVGFTTDNPIEAQPYQESRTSLYCTDIAKMLDAPVFHVNGDDPEAVVFVTRLAADYRDTFHKDVIIDLVTYRRHGHNEADEPAITQPLMYQKIKAHPTTRELYARKLVEEGVVPAGEPERMIEEYRKGLDQGKNIARSTLGLVGNQYTVDWSRYQQGNLDSPVRTAVSAGILQELNRRLLTFPDGFVLHPRVAAIMEGLGLCRDNGLRHAAQRRLRRAPVRPGCRSRHLRAPACGGAQPERRQYLDCAGARLAQGALCRQRFAAVRGGRAGLRVRLQHGRAQRAGDLGGPVRRLRQRRPGGHRPVHRRRPGQMGAPVRPDPVPAARLRRAGPGALLGAPRALPAALRREQHAGLRALNAGADVPHAAPPDAAQRARAAGGDDAQEPAAAQAVGLDAGRPDRRPFPERDRG
jgi:2-oxoglutarate dehydrogenase E1 component